MAFYPLFFDLKNRPILIIGGGKTAFEKAERLECFQAKIHVTAKEICQDFSKLKNIELRQKSWEKQDLNGMFLVIAATDSKSENEKIAQACKEQNILVNCVDDAANSTCIFGAVVEEGGLSIGISTSGASPSAAIYLKQQIAKSIPENFDEILDWLAAIRPQIIDSFPQAERSSLFHHLFQACMEKRRPLSRQEYEKILESASHV